MFSADMFIIYNNDILLLVFEGKDRKLSEPDHHAKVSLHALFLLFGLFFLSLVLLLI